jgi:hypothetical protein
MIITGNYKTLRDSSYNRDKAVGYAHEWAFKRNPKYFNFDSIGGDCTNFASQAILEGSRIMNYTPLYGWYYINGYNKTPSWTSVNFLFKFLVNSKGAGPFAEIVDIKDAEPGDIIQLSFDEGNIFSHSLIVVKAGSPANTDNILISTHTFDRNNYPLSSYSWVDLRVIHITGVRK